MTTVSVLASGRGSNFQAIADHKKLGVFKNIDIGVLIYNYPDAGVKKIADIYGIDSRLIEHRRDRREFYGDIMHALVDYKTDLICLAGWDQIIGKEFYEPNKGRLMSMKPALLPGYGRKAMNAMNLHEAVLKDGAKVTGCTVFFPDVSIERGPIILQLALEVGEYEKKLFWEDYSKNVSIEKNRGVQFLSDRVLVLEHRLYSKAVQLFADSLIETKTFCMEEDTELGKCKDEIDVVEIRCDKEWEKSWSARQSRYIEFQEENLAERGLNLGGLSSPRY
ncbi:formyltransferase family protein [[Eubacterium] cellulosolvens]